MRWWNRQTNNGMTTLINGVIPMNLDEFLKHNQRLDIQDVGPWILGKVASGHGVVFHVHQTLRLRPGGTSNLVLETSIGLGSKLRDFRVDVGFSIGHPIRRYIHIKCDYMIDLMIVVFVYLQWQTLLACILVFFPWLQFHLDVSLVAPPPRPDRSSRFSIFEPWGSGSPEAWRAGGSCI